MSIRFKVILPYLLLTLIVAVTGAYIVTRLVSSSLNERLTNQLVEAGRVISDTMARQEVRQLESARLVAYTRGLGDAVQAGSTDQVIALAQPVAGGSNVENLMIFDAQGGESVHLIKQSDGSIPSVTQPGSPTTLAIVTNILAENNPGSLPRRELALDPVDGRYYYFTSIPVVAGNQVVGAAVVGTSLNTLLMHLKSTALADVIIYGENGLAIASSLGGTGTEILFQRTISITPTEYQEIIVRDDTVQGQNILAEGSWYSLARGPLKVGGDRIAVFAVVLPQDFVVQSGATNRNVYVILYSAAMLAVILIGYFVARLIINPLSKLVHTSRAIAGGDLTRRTDIESRDEIGVLATTFDRMTENLQQRSLELEKTNRILEQMDRTKMRFIHVAGHELRTPLTLVQGYAQMIQMKSKGNEDFTKYSSGIREGSSRMVEIIDSMLDVSRIDTNQLEIMRADMEIQPVMEKVNNVFQSALQERNISLAINGLADLPVLCADKDQLYKVFYHVIGNAIKYTPDGGRIMVGGRVVESVLPHEIEITIRDTGIGIDPQNQELVFEKFYQTGEVLLHSSGKTKFKGGGPGLGLAIARGIVNAHRGRIWLESPGYDETTNPGTTVFVRLPIKGPDNEDS
ncbi:MAG TPA: ATP-binding protein [Anaerolineales bacterium]|nr:ATP-binding protein [Anaerolineales bacterium]